MRLYKSLSYFSLAALLGVSLADVEITGVNKLPVSTPSRLDVLKTKKFPSLFNAKVDIDFASNTYEISSRSCMTSFSTIVVFFKAYFYLALLLPSSDEEGIPFSVSYTSSLVDIGDISQYIIKAGEDEAISADDFEVDGWQMNFLPLQVDKDAPSLAMKFVAVSPEG